MQFRISRRLVLALVLSITAVISWWILNTVQTEGTGLSQAPPHAVDYYLEDFKVTDMSKGGRPQYRLIARKLTHYLDNDTADLVQPTFVFYQEPDEKWSVRAHAGQIVGKGEVVKFRDEVVMLRETKSDRPHLQLNAEDMEFMVSNKQARTANRVEILYDGSRVEAIGLHFSIKDRLLNLLSNVRGQYASPQD